MVGHVGHLSPLLLPRQRCFCLGGVSLPLFDGKTLSLTIFVAFGDISLLFAKFVLGYSTGK